MATTTDLVGKHGVSYTQTKTIGFGDLVSADTEQIIALPAGTLVTDVKVTVDEVFNSLTSDTLIVGDGVTDDRYVTAGDLTAAGAVTPKGAIYVLPANDTIDVKWTGVGTAPTTGIFTIAVTYVLPSKTKIDVDLS